MARWASSHCAPPPITCLTRVVPTRSSNCGPYERVRARRNLWHPGFPIRGSCLQTTPLFFPASSLIPASFALIFSPISLTPYSRLRNPLFSLLPLHSPLPCTRAGIQGLWGLLGGPLGAILGLCGPSWVGGLPDPFDLPRFGPSWGLLGGFLGSLGGPLGMSWGPLGSPFSDFWPLWGATWTAGWQKPENGTIQYEHLSDTRRKSTIASGSLLVSPRLEALFGPLMRLLWLELDFCQCLSEGPVVATRSNLLFQSMAFVWSQ